MSKGTEKGAGIRPTDGLVTFLNSAHKGMPARGLGPCLQCGLRLGQGVPPMGLEPIPADPKSAILPLDDSVDCAGYAAREARWIQNPYGLGSLVLKVSCSTMGKESDKGGIPDNP